ncbi:MAG: extracellular solute-binding protein [Acidimicrobiales bacterium]
MALSGEIGAFEKQHPSISVKDVVIPNDAALEPKLLAGIVGHTLPTLSQLNPQWASHFIQTKTIVNLTPFVHGSHVRLSEFYPSMVDAGRWPGNKQYLLPFNLSDALILYNATLFAKKGITSPPKTWTAFVADAAKLSGGKDHAFAITLVHSYPWRAFFYSAGGKIVKPDGQPDLASLSPSGAAGAALGLWGKMVKDGEAILTQGYGSQTDFANETSSILVGTSAFYPYIKTAVAGKFKIGIAPMPADKAASTALFGGYLGMFSQASSAQKAAAFTFIKYLTSVQGQVYWLEHSQGYLPVRRDAARAAASFLTAHPAQRVALAQLGNAVPEPQYSWYDEFDDETLIPTIEAVSIGKESAQAGARALYSGALKYSKSS